MYKWLCVKSRTVMVCIYLLSGTILDGVCKLYFCVSVRRDRVGFYWMVCIYLESGTILDGLGNQMDKGLSVHDIAPQARP